MAIDLLTHPRYTERITTVKDIFTDKVINPLEEAKFWINRTIKMQKISEKFKRKGMFLYTFQYFYMPEIVALSVLILFMAIF